MKALKVGGLLPDFGPNLRGNFDSLNLRESVVGPFLVAT